MTEFLASIICPQCGAPCRIPKDALDTLRCEYCGASLQINKDKSPIVIERHNIEDFRNVLEEYNKAVKPFVAPAPPKPVVPVVKPQVKPPVPARKVKKPKSALAIAYIWFSITLFVVAFIFVTIFPKSFPVSCLFMIVIPFIVGMFAYISAVWRQK